MEKPFIAGFKATLGCYAARAVISLGILSVVLVFATALTLILRS